MKRLANALFLLVFLAALAAVPAGTLLSAPRGVSFWENRVLAAPVELTAESLTRDDIFSRVETFYSDHVLWRDRFMRLQTWADLRLGRPVVNTQVLGDGVLLNFMGYNRWDTGSYLTHTRAAAEPLAQLNEQVTGYGGYFCFVGAPQQYSYFSHRYPDYLDDYRWSTVPARSAFAQALDEQGVPFLGLLTVYDALGHKDSFYSSVDHHYTFEGALTAYGAIIDHLNANAGLSLTSYLPGDGLTLEELPNHYLGSKNRKLYDLWPSEETVTIGYPTEDIPFTRTDNGAEVPATVYDLPQTEEEFVFYTIYMGGDKNETVIRTNRPDLPSVLIVGESYTNAVESVLWCSFDEMRSLDLRNYTLQSLSDYIDAYRPDVVIVLRDDSTYLTPIP